MQISGNRLRLNSLARGKRAVVLVTTLAMIMLMAWVMVELLVSVRRELMRGQSPADQGELREISYQLLDISIGVLAEVRRFEGNIYAPIQGWGRPLRLARVAETEWRPAAMPGLSGDTEYFRSSPEGGDDNDLLDEDSLLAEILNEEDTEEPPPFRASTGLLLGIEDETAEEDQEMELSVEMAEISFRPGIEVSVEIFDESGKLSLTRTSESRWRLFFEEMGFEENEQRILTDSLLDWMDSDDEARPYGAETEFYSQRDPPYRAANRPLRDFKELRLIQGFDVLFFEENGTPNENFNTFRNAVSLFSVSPVNLNSANRLVLETLAEEQGFDVDEVENFISGPDLVRGTADDRILRPGISQDDLPRRADGEFIKHNQHVRMVQVLIHVSSGNSHFHLTAIIDLEQAGTAPYPMRVLQVVENKRKFQ